MHSTFPLSVISLYTFSLKDFPFACVVTSLYTFVNESRYWANGSHIETRVPGNKQTDNRECVRPHMYSKVHQSDTERTIELKQYCYSPSVLAEWRPCTDCHKLN